MDRRTILAIVLSALILVLLPEVFARLGWIPRRSPRPAPTSMDTLSTPAAIDTQLRDSILSPVAPDRAPSPLPELAGARPGRKVMLRNGDLEATFDSRGAQLETVRLSHFRGQTDSAVVLASGPILQLDLGSDHRVSPLAGATYEVAESAGAPVGGAVRFSLADTSGVRVVQRYQLSPDGYMLDLFVEMDGVLARGFSDYRLTLRSWPLVTERNVSEDISNLQAVAKQGDEVRRMRFKDLRQPRTVEGSIRWSAVRSKYFAAAAIPEAANTKAAYSFVPDPRPGEPAPPTGAPSQRVATSLVLPVPPPGTTHHIKIYAGPNDYWRMSKVGGDLQDVIDLGWRWLLPFSRAILVVMVFLERFIPNYGLVIIVLSALVKLVFHPLTAASMKSMRAMQKIQPELKRLQERYKKDPQKLNQAVMELYKQNRVNPLGGCLPLLIQMPVLFALYQVFLHALELRQAPFISWINDLSAPDTLFAVAGFPIRILPLIMYGSAWLQQRMTPTDPQQVMTMHLMNLFLLVIFYNLPSGLVLYWTVTNLLTALQQYLVNRGGDRPLVVKAA